MTAPGSPLLEIVGLEMDYRALRPLRIARLAVGRGDRYVISGLDAAAAEAFVHLITGAILPGTGEVRVAGRSTRDIANDAEWLASLDRFGIVTERAILLESMTTAANLALPLTLAIEPMPADVRQRVAQLADEVGLEPARLDVPASALAPEERMRVHLARALALDPLVLLLEHPTARLTAAAAESFGATLKQLSDARGLAWVAIAADEGFARATGGTRLRLKAATGELAREGFWSALLGQRAKGKGQNEGQRAHEGQRAKGKGQK